MVFEINAIGQVFLRLVLLFFSALIVVRIMGNRTVGQLSPFDFVIMVGIGDIIITGAMDRNQTIWSGIEGLVALLVLQQVLSYLALKNVTLRKWFEGTPVTLIENGRILRERFVQTQFNYDDLRQELHRNGMEMNDIANIRLARLESCGSFTIIKKPECEPITKNDLKDYLASFEQDPLSPIGEKWMKLERHIEEVHYLTEYLKQNMNIPERREYPDNELH